MSRKQVFLIAASLLAVVVVGVGTTWWATLQPPEFYRSAEKQVHNPVVRKQVAREFTARTQQLAEEIRKSDQWSDHFTEAQINAWLIEEFPKQFGEWIPDGVSDPRIRIERQAILLGFKYEQPEQWSGVVSLEVRAWVPEPNRLAIQIASIKAGLISIPIDAILEQVIQHASESGAEIEWRTQGATKIAVITLAPIGEGEPQLQQVELTEGELRVSGTSKPESGCFQFEPLRMADRLNEQVEPLR